MPLWIALHAFASAEDAPPAWDVPYRGVTAPPSRVEAPPVDPGRPPPYATSDVLGRTELVRLPDATTGGVPIPDPRVGPEVVLDEATGQTLRSPRPPMWVRGVLGVVGGVVAVGATAYFTMAVGSGIEP